MSNAAVTDVRSLARQDPSSRPGPAGLPSLPAVPRLTFGRIAAVELRKTVDTRAGRWLLVLIGGLAIATVAWRVTHLTGGTATFDSFVNMAVTGVALIVPVLGILAMTTEWTQRTALTTFTLAPRRGHVLAAKLLAALILTVLASLFAIAVAAAGLLLDGAATSNTTDWTGWLTTAGGVLVITTLNTLMGAAFGTLLGHTAASVTWFYVAPNLVTLATNALLQSRADWVSYYPALNRISTFDVSGRIPQLTVTMTVWIALPLAVGLIRCLRRNVT